MTRRLPAALLAIVISAGLVGACGDDSGDDAATTAPGPTTSTSRASERGLTGGNRIDTTLNGAAEIPGPGDKDGTGTAGISEDNENEDARFCYVISVKGIDVPTAAHIHRADAGAAGPVVVTLSPLLDDSAGGYGSSTCLKIDDALHKEIFNRPEGFYFNVHTKAFPNGAIRGQLPAKGA